MTEGAAPAAMEGAVPLHVVQFGEGAEMPKFDRTS
jgi:hypothetical protein